MEQATAAPAVRVIMTMMPTTFTRHARSAAEPSTMFIGVQSTLVERKATVQMILGVNGS
jgi:hypothetical protein